MEHRRKDITVEKVVAEYKKFPNLHAIAEKFDCSHGLIRSRLEEAGVSVDSNCNPEYRRCLKPEVTERKIFDTKAEQAHYICTELADSLADLIIEVKTQMSGGGYARADDYRLMG